MLKATVTRYFGIVSTVTFKTDSFHMEIEGVEDNTVWQKLLKESYYANFCYNNNYSSIFTSHNNNNGYIDIERKDDIVTFTNRNILGCLMQFTLPFEECKEAFTYLANECSTSQ